MGVSGRREYLHEPFAASGVPPGESAYAYACYGACRGKGTSGTDGVDVQIKWPNDLVVQGRKICGILTEMSTEMTWINYVVIGIGINVNQNEFPEELKDCASSLKMETGRRSGART